MSGEHTHPDLADQVASVHLDLIAEAARVARLDAAQAATDAAIKSLLARVAALETDTDPTPEWSANGIPPAGKCLAGATVQGGTEAAAATFEALVGPMGVRRSFWSSTQQASAITCATADLKAERLPWVSFKLPGNGAAGNWAKIAAGSADAWAADLATRLGNLPGPVWVAIHHEPEGDPDGTPADWVKVQQRLSPMFRAHPNIAYTIILMGWHQWMGTDPALKMDALWAGPGVVDVLGFDPYNWFGSVTNPDGKFTELRAYAEPISVWADAHGVPWAIAETGYTDTAAAKDAAWLTRAYDDTRALGGRALSYFHYATANMWPITGPKVPPMTAVLAKADRLP